MLMPSDPPTPKSLPVISGGPPFPALSQHPRGFLCLKFPPDVKPNHHSLCFCFPGVSLDHSITAIALPYQVLDWVLKTSFSSVWLNGGPRLQIWSFNNFWGFLFEKVVLIFLSWFMRLVTRDWGAQHHTKLKALQSFPGISQVPPKPATLSSSCLSVCQFTCLSDRWVSVNRKHLLVVGASNPVCLCMTLILKGCRAAEDFYFLCCPSNLT